LLYGGSVRDSACSLGKNISTTLDAYEYYADPTYTNMSMIILSHVGSGKTFPYEENAIYAFV
jgi:hypothetical protein